MLCCCAKKSSTSYVVEDAAKSSEASHVKSSAPTSTDTKIITGKGALSTSTQNLAAGEANLDKSTVSATKKEKSPVTEQPVSNQTDPKETSDTQQTAREPSERVLADKVNVEQPKSVSVISVNNSQPAPPQCIEKAIESCSAKALEAAPNNPNPDYNNPTALGSMNSAFEKVEKELSEAESKKSTWEAGAVVPGIAAQVKVLTSQVLAQASAASASGMGDQGLGSAVSRLEAVATRLEALAGSKAAASAGDSDEVSPFVIAYDEIVSGPLANYSTLSNDIGGDVKTQASLVKDAFAAQRAFLVVASKSKQPDNATLMQVLKPSATKLQAVQEFRENNRRSEYFNHLSALSESIAALGWVTIAPAPGPYVKEMVDAGTFYTNRVLKDYKEKDPKHVEWTRAWIKTLTELQAYIKQFHTTGLVWNPRGGDAKNAAPSAAPPAGGAAPPPPPPGPPPPPPPPTSSEGSSDDGGSRAALFAAISKGENVTKGLRKVTDDMKTHKNPALRQGPAPFKATQPKPASPKPVTKPVAAAPAKPPLIELQGHKKWVVEYHKDNREIVIDQTELKQTLYVYKCEGCVIQLKGKINSVILDSCKKTAIVFDSLLASLEFVNCQSMQAQVNGKLPIVSIDKTDGCMIYLSNESLDVEVVSAKSSEMNILVPKGDGDYKEFALPEQFKTKYDGKTMVTTIAESI